jgi:hypothetical protein
LHSGICERAQDNRRPNLNLQKSRKGLNTMTRSAMTNFAAGLLVGIAIAAFVMLPNRRSEEAPGDVSSNRVENVGGATESHKSDNSFLFEPSLRGVSTPEGDQRNSRALKVAIWDYTASDAMGEFLSKLNEKQAGQLTESLEDLRGRLDRHESEAAITVDKTTDRVEVLIPPLFSGTESASAFRDELADRIGPDLAEEFFRVDDTDLALRFAQWGTAEQRLHIDLSRTPPYIENRITTEGSLATFGTRYTSASKRFAHLFRIEDAEEPSN